VIEYPVLEVLGRIGGRLRRKKKKNKKNEIGSLAF